VDRKKALNQAHNATKTDFGECW